MELHPMTTIGRLVTERLDLTARLRALKNAEAQTNITVRHEDSKCRASRTNWVRICTSKPFL